MDKIGQEISAKKSSDNADDGKLTTTDDGQSCYPINSSEALAQRS